MIIPPVTQNTKEGKGRTVLRRCLIPLVIIFAGIVSALKAVHPFPSRARRAATFVLCVAGTVLAAGSASATTNTITFAFHSALGNALTNMDVTITPTTVQLGSFGFADTAAIPATTDGTNGQFILTNLTAGSYYVRTPYSFTPITVSNVNFTGSWTNLISPLLVPGATAVYTRGQSDSRYFQSTNATVVNLTASNSVWLGSNNFNAATNYGGYSLSPTNLSGTDSNLSLIGSTVISGPLSYGAATTNLQTLTGSYTVAGPTNILPGATSNLVVTLSGVGTNGDWAVTVTPNITVSTNCTNVVITAAIAATNSVQIHFANAGPTTNTLGTNQYRVEARQYQ